MKPIPVVRILTVSTLAGLALTLGVAGVTHWFEPPQLKPRWLATDLAISEQLRPDMLDQVARRRFATLIDLRPDGEATDQPSSAEMAAAAHAQGLAFAYIPVPHGDVPEPAVVALTRALDENPKGILLYCRTGRRAGRVWALVEASRPAGKSAEEILTAVANSGQSAEDMKAEIARRIALRGQEVRHE